MAVKNENYIAVFGWMVNNLKLKGNELLVYALLYGFSQDSKSEFAGNAEYIAEWLNTSRRTVVTVLNNLEGKGLIKKRKTRRGRGTCLNYSVTEISVKNFPLSVKKFPNKCEETSHRYYKDKTNKNNKRNSFHNFDEREYDFKALEDELIGK